MRVLLLISLFSLTALADVKLGYVDLKRAIELTGEGQAAKAKLKAEVDKKKAEFELEQRKLREDSLLLDRQSSAMSEEVRVQKMKELQGRILQNAEKGQKLQAELLEREQVELKKIFDRMDPIVKQIAERDGLAMVFERTDSGLIYAPMSSDLTNELIRTYNDKFPVKGFKPPVLSPAPTPKPVPGTPTTPPTGPAPNPTPAPNPGPGPAAPPKDAPSK
ncbi:MAG: OmpH family outer membrane protein [Archangium sp.]|nr:OmpH family outer membrane protein [Archangium sp.]